jgi:acyl carrier protein
VNRPPWLLMVVLAAGCSGSPEPVGTGPAPAKDPEEVVRAAMSAVFKVQPSSVDMNRPLCDAPTKADDLDLVELVMEIEERLGVEIPDEKVQEFLGGQLGKVPIRITPAQLVVLAQQAKPGSRSKKR